MFLWLNTPQRTNYFFLISYHPESVNETPRVVKLKYERKWLAWAVQHE